eukprot:Gb_28594 [translate_table: standard]
MNVNQDNPLALACLPSSTRDPSLQTPYLPASVSVSQISVNAQPLASIPPQENGRERETETEDDKKRQREHKKRSKNWTRQETLRLIRIRSEFEPRFARSGRKSDLWDEISMALQRENICRDAQQCRDKWEKLTAGYKEVRDGVKNKQDNPFFDELQPLLSARPHRRDKDAETPVAAPFPSPNGDKIHRETPDDDEETEDGSPSGKRRKNCQYLTATSLDEVLENLFARQQKFFRELLDSIERKEQIREQIRQEKEEKWRAEERAQRCTFNNAMIVLTKKLLGQNQGAGLNGLNNIMSSEVLDTEKFHTDNNHNCSNNNNNNPKKRSKNWKRAEVLRLIKFRGEMETRFVKSSRRAALWDEVAELLAMEGIKRDGKQCREKWDKLIAVYKEVSDGKREAGESPYFTELTAIVGRPCEEGQLKQGQEQMQSV